MNASPTPPSGVDAAFLRRVYLASLAVAVLGGVAGGVWVSWRWGAGFAAMGAWSVANLRALEVLLRLSVTVGPRQPVAILVAGIIKLPLLYGVGALLAIKGGFPPVSLLAGFSIPLAVLVLKIGGQLLAPKVALSDRPTAQPPHRS